MATRWQLFAVTLCLILAAPLALHADIYRWDNGQVIPGTEGITPGPGVQLNNRELRYADLTSFDLTGANFASSDLTGADFRGSQLTNANLAGAIVKRARLSLEMTAEQLYSTASYQTKDLQGIRFPQGSNLSYWDFSGQDLTGAAIGFCGFGICSGAGLGHTNFMNANLTNARLPRTYLQNANLRGANLTGADLSRSNLIGADLTAAVVRETDFTHTIEPLEAFTKEQLYATASYQAKDLQGIKLSLKHLEGWDFSGQDLTNADLIETSLNDANFTRANLTNTNLQGSDLTNVTLRGANLKNTRFDAYPEFTLSSATFDATTLYNQWTSFNSDFNPTAQGLTLVLSNAGDLNGDDDLDAADVDILANKTRGRPIRTSATGAEFDLPNAAFDLNGDSNIDLEDHRMWIKDLKHTWFGDANLDGEFNSNDFVRSFAAGRYEEIPIYAPQGYLFNVSGWSQGDWNGDGLFSSDDFITAFQDGGYEQGPRTDVAAVPEPGGVVLLVIGFVLWLFGFRIHRAVS